MGIPGCQGAAATKGKKITDLGQEKGLLCQALSTKAVLAVTFAKGKGTAPAALGVPCVRWAASDGPGEGLLTQVRGS